MPFASGAVSFQRFAVVGQHPKAPTEALLDKLADHRLLEDDITNDEETYGWCGGRHLLDGDFGFEQNVYNDCLHFGLRVDTNKPPSDLKRAYLQLEEQAASKDGFITKAAKRDAKDAAMRKLDDERSSGNFRKSKFTPLLWDVGRSTLYGPTSITLQEKLFELFDRTFGLTLIPLSSGELALRRLESTGKRRDYEDVRPTSFGPTDQAAEYPWVAKGPQAKNFLGNEFATWLWFMSETNVGGVDTANGPVDVVIEKMIDLDCVFGLTGRDVLRGDTPTRSPEARHALRTGKVVRKMTLILDGPATYALTLNAENLAAGSLSLPDVDEADTPRVLFEERINLLRDFDKTIDGLMNAFLQERTGGRWAATTKAMRQWVAKHTQP